MSGYRPRLSIELTEEQYLSLQRNLSHGEGRALFSAIVDDLINLMEEHGNMVVAVIAGKKLLPREMLPTMKEAVEFVDTYRRGKNGND